MPKSSKHIVLQRIRVIAGLLIKGNSRDDIIQYSSENWRIGERQADKYIQKAKSAVGESVKKSVEYDYAKAVRRYEELYKLAMGSKDLRAAIAANKEITALQGLFKQQLELSGEVKFICSVPE
jgi:hypothetical protein